MRSIPRAALCAVAVAGLAMPLCAAPAKPPFTAEDYRADYSEACRLVAGRYVALEEKTGSSRERFLHDSLRDSSEIGKDDSKAGFVRAMWKLRARIADGHFDWSLPPELRDGRNKVLGVIPTWRGGKLVVGAARPGLPAGAPEVGDVLVSWDGAPAAEAVARQGRTMPQSSPASTAEIAARMLEMSPAWAPLHDVARPVRVVFDDKSGARRSATLQWRDNDAPLSHNGYPSLEEIPAASVQLAESLVAYRLDSSSRRAVIAHPLKFDGWGSPELDRLLDYLRSERADLLVIDLRDSAGGGFECVMELSRFLGIDRGFAFKQREWDERSGRIVESAGDFSSLAAPRASARQWRGELLVRTNPVCGSACDYFAAWTRLSGRGKIVGEPSAGRGIGTDEFALGRTGTTICVPVRDRTILPEGLRIEGNPIKPDFPFEGTMAELIEAYCAGSCRR